MLPKGLKLPPLRTLDDQHAESIPQEYREELQAKSLAAFTWRTLEALREAWNLAIPGAWVELVMYDMRASCGYVLGRPHIESLPFPWPEKRLRFYFYVPNRLVPYVLTVSNSKTALGTDGVSVNAGWVLQCVFDVLKAIQVSV